MIASLENKPLTMRPATHWTKVSKQKLQNNMLQPQVKIFKPTLQPHDNYDNTNKVRSTIDT